MTELLEIKLETRCGDMIKHFSLMWWIQAVGSTVGVGCLQATSRILFKYNLGVLYSLYGGDEKCEFSGCWEVQLRNLFFFWGGGHCARALGVC